MSHPSSRKVLDALSRVELRQGVGVYFRRDEEEEDDNRDCCGRERGEEGIGRRRRKICFIFMVTVDLLFLSVSSLCCAKLPRETS
jgi:hypothetical protein